jgi:diguanylate cyclase (GGDEF)-like protein/PAS domain S-box-containing protein
MRPGFVTRLIDFFHSADAAAPVIRTLTTPVVDYRALTEASLDMICHVQLTNGNIKFTYTSSACPDIVGWSCEELLELSPADLFTEESMVIIGADVAKIRAGHHSSSVVVEAICKDGRNVWLENKVRVLNEESEGVMTVIVSMRDVTERKLLQDQLAQQAMFDGLTGIHNRRAFDEAIARESRIALRDGLPLSLILIDIDHFKLLNDHYGHQLGDDCLRAVASSIRASVKRSQDFVARYGGEEFAALLPATDMAGAAIVANEIRAAVEDLKIPNAGNVSAGRVITVSCGVSTSLCRRGGTVELPAGLVSVADSALYKAKSKGRNCVVASPFMTSNEFLVA